MGRGSGDVAAQADARSIADPVSSLDELAQTFVDCTAVRFIPAEGKATERARVVGVAYEDSTQALAF